MVLSSCSLNKHSSGWAASRLISKYIDGCAYVRKPHESHLPPAAWLLTTSALLPPCNGTSLLNGVGLPCLQITSIPEIWALEKKKKTTFHLLDRITSICHLYHFHNHNHRMAQVGKDIKDHSVPTPFPWTGLLLNTSACTGPHLIWSSMFPRMGHP